MMLTVVGGGEGVDGFVDSIYVCTCGLINERKILKRLCERERDKLTMENFQEKNTWHLSYNSI